ncbi:PH (Pleckstrin Homology) domain-containing protein [Micromonospora kangleipakensis]|uniref:PH (Pleckstrin Homology) domain-containing protein n=2 Tax=Micromonospora kangleipakensis TaxID=1077942 RepID=A0A4Q8B4K0_9ACTN|nr:PH (Pleckstrin Homology) domain-containing protein [Micromonospora kangleipakensis]
MRPMPNWVRPYEGDQDDLHTLRYVVAAGMSVAGLFPLCGAASRGLSGAALPAVVLFVVTWEVVLWRVVLVGVYVSDHGIKIRTVLRTRVIPWSQVTRAWAGQAANYDAWQIWVSARDPERELETPIWRRGSRARHRNRVVLPPEEFAAALAALNSRR